MSKINEKYGVIYIWYDRKHKRYYIGSHWGSNPETDGYICSSNWMRDAYRRRPQDFKRRIISRIYTSHKDLLAKELEWFSLIKPEEIRIRYYNLNITSNKHWAAGENSLSVRQKLSIANTGNKHSEASKEKISNAGKGRVVSKETRIKIGASNKGKVRSEETKEKLSLSAKNRPPASKETIAKRSVSNTGKKRSEESKAKMTAWQIGKKHSDETKSKMSAAKKGKKRGPMSEETKAKIGASNKGKIRSEETKITNY